MDWLIIPGALVSLIGLAGLVLSAVRAMQARRDEPDDTALRERLQKVVVLNMAALFLSVIGLMMVAVGVLMS